jgi:hypothetical protein
MPFTYELDPAQFPGAGENEEPPLAIKNGLVLTDPGHNDDL